MNFPWAPAAVTPSNFVTSSIRGIEPLGSCCMGQILKWRPRNLGDRLECTRCHNVVSVVEATERNISKTISDDCQHVVAKVAEGWKVTGVVYDTQVWADFKIEADLDYHNLYKGAEEPFNGCKFYAQFPLQYLHADTVQVEWMEPGKYVIVGKVKENVAVNKEFSKEDLYDSRYEQKDWFDKVL